jgi:hypothetical protein
VNVELDESEESGAEDEGDEEDKRSDQEQEEEVKLDIEDEDADIHQVVKREEEGVLDITDIDAQWLNRTLSGLFNDLMAEEVQELEGRLMKVLSLENARDCEKKLFGVLGVDKFELIRLLVRNKAGIYWGTLLQQAQTPAEKETIKYSMDATQEGRDLLKQMTGKKSTILDEVDHLTKKYKQPTSEDVTSMLTKRVTDEILFGSSKAQKMLDFDHLQFQQGARLMANKKCLLPKGS